MSAVHGELTADGRHIVLIATGAPWQVKRAAWQLRLLTPLIKASTPPGAVTLPASWQAVVQLAHTFSGNGHGSWRPGPRLTSWTAAELARRTVQQPDLTVTLPEGCVPRSYQVAGARMIAATGRVALFDDPGTGKTISTIVGLLERAQTDGVLPVIVVCPASVADPWAEAWRTWAPQWRTVVWRGIPARRKALAGTADIYITSYDTARMDVGELGKLHPGSVVADECHYLKSPHAARSVSVRKLAKQAGNVVALSGTPITHHPGDLWPTLEALVPVAWPSRERWTRRYCESVPGDYSEEILGLNAAAEPEFRAALLGHHRRVAKADVLTELPPKVYSVRTVELPAAYRRAYDQMERQMLAELPGGAELSVMSVLAQLTRLTQMASAAADLEITAEPDEYGEVTEHVSVRLKAPSWKADALLEVLAERPGEQVVAFAPSRQLIMVAGAAAEQAGYRVGYVAGGQAMTARTDTINTFQAGKLDLLAVTTGAGGTGLTFTAARTAVFLQRPWSLAEAVQAEDRLHRIGAERHESIEIVDIVAKNTIDSRVRAVLRGKAGQLADLVQDPRIVTGLLGGSQDPASPTEGGRG
jgi:SNF2 family DNA or RNA helicase